MPTQFLCGVAFSSVLSGCLLSDFKKAEDIQSQRDWSTREPTSVANAGEDSGHAVGGGGDGGAVEPSAGRAAAGGGAGKAGGSSGSGGVSGTAGANAVAGHSGAGASGGAGARAGAGAGGMSTGMPNAGRSGAAGNAGAAGSGSACGDTTRDPLHCGACAIACAADEAQVSCIASKCVRTCSAGFDDCNGDLGRGNDGDGCETSVQDDVEHCGSCQYRCQGAAGAVSSCESRRCIQTHVDTGAGSTVSPLRGSATGGNPYEQLCGRSSALVGFDVAGDSDYLYGLNALCAAQVLNESSDSLIVRSGETQAFPMLGNGLVDAPKPIIRLLCPEGMLATALGGGTAYFGSNDTFLALRELVLTCSRITVNAKRELEFGPGTLLNSGQMQDFKETFTDACPAGHVIVGIKGRSGGYVDSLQPLCAPLLIVRIIDPNEATQ